ncbi:MAG: hypothetical protein II877_04660 [Synergistaceae bacterium]|nr:hypothetical protein [Synergistaceae bacterium]
MLEGVKKFLKAHVFTDAHPFFMGLWLDRMERRFRREAQHSHMTYAEIEAEISRQYEAIFGRKLNWENPQTYNEKINVSKLYMPSPLKTRLADKVAVREWVTEKIGGEYLVPLIGVYDSFDDIDFDALPDSFVIKCSHDSGSVTLVKDKHKLNMALMRRKYDLHMGHNFAWMGFEMHYRDIPHKIIIERYLGDAINDYKFLCFDGRPCYCWVDFDRYTNHKRNMYNLDWELQPFNQYHYGNYEEAVKCPESFGAMKRIATKLCEGFGHVRVDLYVV